MAHAATESSGLDNPMQRALARMGLETTDFTRMAGPLGVTPKETVYAEGTTKLYRYQPLADSVYRVPVLIVTSLVNQPYILDLVPGQSLVEFLLRQGYDVFMVEWGRPRLEHKGITLEHYVLERLPTLAREVARHAGESDLSIIGYCVGGLLAALYAATAGAAPSGRVLKNLVCIATPVNGDGLESLKTWLGPDFDEEALLAEHGNVPGELIQNTLRALRPLGKVAGAMNLLNNIGNADTVRSNLRMGKWETDNLPLPGGVFRQLVTLLLRENLIVKGHFPLGGKVVDLSAIQAPFLHILAQDDHITPYVSSHDLLKLVGSSDKQEIMIKGGHVGLVAGRGAELRMWPALDGWLAPRSV